MFWGLFLQIVAAILGLWLAQKYVPGVDFTGPIFPLKWTRIEDYFNTLVFVGILLGFLNYFVKPILNKITLPIRIITFNFFSLIILMFLVWLVDIFSRELIIKGIKALFFVTIIVWLIHFTFSKWWPQRSSSQSQTIL